MMSDKIRQSYFVLMRLALLIIICIHGILNLTEETGVSIRVLLLVSIFIGTMALKEITTGFYKWALVLVSVISCGVLIYITGSCFYMLAFFAAFEILNLFPKIDYKVYFIAMLFCIVYKGFLANGYAVTVLLMMLLYVEHNYVVRDYEKRLTEDFTNEQMLKKSMTIQELEAKEEVRRNMLMAENQVLEERTNLSQTLHDKLGHNINGSIYQLEGVKLLMEKDPEKSKSMIQAVIDQLRGGMDEIRMILRKERPKKRELALLQLYKLCEDCNNKGVETEFNKEGDLSLISDEIWEVILDNAFEAVSNSMKYARCTHILIELIIMNKILRCSIKDDGLGCKEIKDGMGISGMKARVRVAGGTISFETEAGFAVNMFLPLE